MVFIQQNLHGLSEEPNPFQQTGDTTYICRGYAREKNREMPKICSGYVQFMPKISPKYAQNYA